MGAIKAEIAGKILTLLGYDGTDFYNLKVDADGHLQVDCLSSALPAGAATEAKQDTEIATLELIALIRNALQSVDTDRLIVRGEDQLFSIDGVVWKTRDAVISGANGYIDSDAVPAGKIWIITTIKILDLTSPTTLHYFNVKHEGTVYGFYSVEQAFGAGDPSYFKGQVYLTAGDTFRFNFTGGLVGDRCYTWIGGYQMTAET